MRIKKEQCAAVVVDYQERLMPVMRNADELVRRSTILLKGLKILDVPISMTQQYTKGLGGTISAITEAIETQDFIEKIEFSACSSVFEQIREKQYIIVCGVETHICVLQTVIELKENGFVPVVVADCLSSRNELDHDIAIERMKAIGAIITTSESIIFELLEKAGTKTSKKIQKLVK